jgi:hypothetical protein
VLILEKVEADLDSVHVAHHAEVPASVSGSPAPTSLLRTP